MTITWQKWGIKKKNKVIIICGPTAVGKTTAAIRLSQLFNGEIISADSRQIYKYLDIGTAKPTAAEQAQIRHYIIDIVEPDKPFDAVVFTKMARQIADDLIAKGKTPFLVGGTGLYIKAFVHGLFFNKTTDSSVRQHLKSNAAKHGTLFLFNRLTQCDPITAKRLHPNDTYRIIRALEVFEITGKPISQYQQEHNFAENVFCSLKIGLYLERDKLYERIDNRVDKMIADGFLEEVCMLLKKGYSAGSNAMQSIGYQHIVSYLDGKITWQEAVRTFKRDSRRYAKRQLTWFRSDPEIIWVKPGETDTLIPQIRRFLG
jgi:tRNA dimethylallyltransferase